MHFQVRSDLQASDGESVYEGHYTRMPDRNDLPHIVGRVIIFSFSAQIWGQEIFISIIIYTSTQETWSSNSSALP